MLLAKQSVMTVVSSKEFLDKKKDLIIKQVFHNLIIRKFLTFNPGDYFVVKRISSRTYNFHKFTLLINQVFLKIPAYAWIFNTIEIFFC